MKKINKFLFIAFAVTGLLFSCEDLDVENENTPGKSDVLGSAEDIEKLAAGIYNSAFTGEHRAGGVQAMLATAADHATCSWGNFGMRDMSFEPRDNAWNNTPVYANQGQTKYSYDNWYSSIGAASTVLDFTDVQGKSIVIGGVDQTKRAKAFAKFGLGIAYGNLALVFDKAHIVDEVKTAEGNIDAAVPYQDVAAAAIGYLDEALALSNESFTIPASWMGSEGDLTNTDFKKIINTSAARLLSYMPRNKTELASVDWAKVKTYADAGITADWNVVMDGTNKWYFEAGDYLVYPGWGRTDMYVVNLMEPSMPQHWDDSPTFPTPAKATNPLDSRLDTDFAYLPSNDFLAARGYYHFSCYRMKRYDDIYTAAIGAKPTVMKAENDMLKAEARAYTGDLAGAAAIINAGTRVTRGNLDPVAANLSDIVKAIHHERQVEMYTTGGGLQFFEMRKSDLLQKGTPLHLPVPGQILQLFGLTQFYSFGTTAKADGTSTSNAGWR
jgi:starch-binding outer membrane protein, SusD/RagB family